MDTLTRKINGVGAIANCAIFAAQVVNYYISKGKLVLMKDITAKNITCCK